MFTYYDTDTQSAHFWGNPHCQATKLHLNDTFCVFRSCFRTPFVCLDRVSEH